VVSGTASIGDPRAPELGNTGYDVQKYTLRLRMDPAEDFLRASTEISAVSRLDGLARLSLDFIGFDITGVDTGYGPASFERQGDKLWISLPQPIAAGDAFSLTVAYEGQPKPYSTRFFPDPVGLFVLPEQRQAYALAEPDGARAWFPANDHPRDPALFEFILETPQPLVGVANGQRVRQERDGGWTRTSYASDDPMAPYLAVVAIGEYEAIPGRTPSGVPLQHYVLPETRAEAAAAFAETGRAMTFLEDVFGPYPFDSYGHVVVDTEGGVAIETQTMTAWGDEFLRVPPDFRTDVIVHELAHQWIGDSLRLASWNDTWLKEGLASYAEILWAERAHPEDAYSLLDNWESSLHDNGALNDQPPDGLYSDAVYVKGAWVFHMLRRKMGDEAFRAFLREYATHYRGQAVTPADLQRVAEEVSGQDLGAFFDQWVARPGNPVLRLQWTADQDDAQARLRVCQLRQGRTDPWDIALPLDLGADRELIQVDEAQEDITLAVTSPVEEIVADPDQEVLADVSVEQVDTLEPCASP
jgi:aminopeptidase N